MASIVTWRGGGVGAFSHTVNVDVHGNSGNGGGGMAANASSIQLAVASSVFQGHFVIIDKVVLSCVVRYRAGTYLPQLQDGPECVRREVS